MVASYIRNPRDNSGKAPSMQDMADSLHPADGAQPTSQQQAFKQPRTGFQGQRGNWTADDYARAAPPPGPPAMPPQTGAQRLGGQMQKAGAAFQGIGQGFRDLIGTLGNKP